MVINNQLYHYFTNPTVDELTTDYETWLMSFDKLAVIDINSGDKPWRVVTTLLHGNEPSGLIAAHQWLTQLAQANYTHQLNYNIRILLVSVTAAQKNPRLMHRTLADSVDINRCFNGCQWPEYQAKAELVVELIKQVSPELIVDMHNTSGVGPAFAVLAHDTQLNKALAAMFTEQVIISHIHIGALMEYSFACPIITLECGGRADLNAHELALCSFEKLAQYPLKVTDAALIKCYHQPLRLRINSDILLGYNESELLKSEQKALTLRADIEQLNYLITPQMSILGTGKLLEKHDFILLDDSGKNVFEQFFLLENQQLKTKVSLQLFMATRNADIAIADCLFYLVSVDN